MTRLCVSRSERLAAARSKRDVAAPLALRVVVVAMIVREVRIERLEVREELQLEGAGHSVHGLVLS